MLLAALGSVPGVCAASCGDGAGAVKGAEAAEAANVADGDVGLKDVWLAYDAFNDVYLDTGKYIYKSDSSVPAAVDRFNGAAAIWCQPIYWDMAMNAAALAERCGERRRAREYRELCRRIFEGERAHYAGFDFEDNNENTGWFIYDDIMWWTISLARAYAAFGEEEYLRLSERSFSRVWYGSERVGDTGSYDAVSGGMFWRCFSHCLPALFPRCPQIHSLMPALKKNYRPSHFQKLVRQLLHSQKLSHGTSLLNLLYSCESP